METTNNSSTSKIDYSNFIISFIAGVFIYLIINIFSFLYYKFLKIKYDNNKTTNIFGYFMTYLHHNFDNDPFIIGSKDIFNKVFETAKLLTRKHNSTNPSINPEETQFLAKYSKLKSDIYKYFTIIIRYNEAKSVVDQNIIDELIIKFIVSFNEFNSQGCKDSLNDLTELFNEHKI